MQNTKEVNKNIFWIGSSNRRPTVFEGVFPIPRGVSYNSYLVKDQKTVILDTVDKSVSGIYFENIAYLLNGKSPDYIIVNHMEPDHASALGDLILRYPNIKIVSNKMIFTMIKQYFDFDVDKHTVVVEEGGTLNTGAYTFHFVMAPMVHWPEVMVSYESVTKTLFSADAFGTFGALDGNLFADEVNFERNWIDDARRYYTNIVGKYGDQVQDILEKAATLEIAMICPLHGPIWRKNIGYLVDKYQKWSSYTPEDNAVLIAYASVYGNTENAVNILASDLSQAGVKNVSVYDVSQTDTSYILSEAFRCSHIVFASTTYNAGIFIKMEQLLLDIKEHQLKNRTVAFIENGSWAPAAGGLMSDICKSFEGWNVIGNTVTLLSSVKNETRTSLKKLAEEIANSMPKNIIPAHDFKTEPLQNAAFFKLTYGLFLLTAKDGGKDNGCIINSAVQLTDNPKRINIAVIKANHTNDMILKTGIFNVSSLSVDTPFSVFQNFGFKSGRDTDKFAICPDKTRSQNGLIYAPKVANAFFSCKVISSTDFGTHTLYTADVTEAAVLSAVPSATYQYYADNIKPKPPVSRKKRKGYICKVCGYFHEGEELPDDYICPLCNHDVSYFEKVG
jgi:flavorubredoxin/flavin reductase (DIM6/NTAB) family NADH-FMN oxidoreductase RutF